MRFYMVPGPFIHELLLFTLDFHANTHEAH